MELRIYPVILEAIALMRVEVEIIQKRDPDLARQMRRASSSIALNTSEGSYSTGGNRRLRYRNAVASARETLACIEVAIAQGYLDAIRSEIAEKMRHIIGTLTNLAR